MMHAVAPQLVLLCGAVLLASGCESPSDAVPNPTSAPVPEGRDELQSPPHDEDDPPPLAEERHAPAVERDAPSPDKTANARPLDRTFDDLKFDIEPDAPYDPSMLTESIEQLAGNRIRIRGYILPTAQRRGIKQFVLVRDNQECCFGDGAALYDCVLVQMAPGKSAEFSIRPVAVTGEFRIEEFRDFEGKTRAVFQMVAERVE